MKKWKTEIDLWSSMPEGTKVWRYGILTGWKIQSEPLWEKEYIYVVNDDNAEIIKQWYDDFSKIEMYYTGPAEWLPTTYITLIDIRKSIKSGSKYRIKPSEPTYYYYVWERLKYGAISTSESVSDECAEDRGYPTEGWRKIISSKRAWDEH